MLFTIRGLLVVLLAAWPAHADVGGHPTVLDGDTLEIAGERIRLHGIDAPERRQRCVVDGETWPCGAEASLALAARIADHRVECEETDTDRYGRIVAVCRIGATDLNAWMVAEGWALAYRRYAMDYTGQEAAAGAARRGIWRGKFVAPWEWRRGKRLVGAGGGADTRTDSESTCPGAHWNSPAPENSPTGGLLRFTCVIRSTALKLGMCSTTKASAQN